MSSARLRRCGFPLVAVGACAFVLTARIHLDGHGDAIGKVVHGTATAAAIWVTAAIGVAAAFGDWVIGGGLSGLAFATLRWLSPIKEAAVDGSHPSDRPGVDAPDSDYPA